MAADQKQTMTLNLPPREMAVLEQLSADADMTKTQVMRQALKLYQLVSIHAKNGRHLMFSGEPPMSVVVVAPGIELDTPRTPNTQASASGKAEVFTRTDSLNFELAACWLEEAARYFERRPTNGEDAAHWSNVGNAENARKYAAHIRRLLVGGEAVHSQPIDQAPAEPPSSSNTEG